MAGKSKTIALTPQEAARAKAGLIVTLESQKKALEAEIEVLKGELTEYVQETNDRNLGVLMAEKRASKPKLDFGNMTAKQKQFATEQLMKELADYVDQKQELNVEKMYFAMSTTPAIVNALKVRGMQIIQAENWAFKTVKEVEGRIA